MASAPAWPPPAAAKCWPGAAPRAASACRLKPLSARPPIPTANRGECAQARPPQRLRKRAQFLFVRDGAKAHRPSLIVEARRRAETGPSGAGFTASRKVGGAVKRNRARRRLKEAARQLLPRLGLPGVDYVLVARRTTAGADWTALLDDLGNALISLRAELEAGAAHRPRRAARTAKPAKARAGPSESD